MRVRPQEERKAVALCVSRAKVTKKHERNDIVFKRCKREFSDNYMSLT